MFRELPMRPSSSPLRNDSRVERSPWANAASAAAVCWTGFAIPMASQIPMIVRTTAAAKPIAPTKLRIEVAAMVA